MQMTKKETLIFTSIMCFFMVLVMSSYNLLLHQGYTKNFLVNLAVGFIPGYTYALFCDIFIVSPPAKAVAFKIVREDDSQMKKILTISFFMITGMVLCMSLFGAIMNSGFCEHFFLVYARGVMMNFIMALPLQLIIIGPLTRTITKAVFSIKQQASR